MTPQKYHFALKEKITRCNSVFEVAWVWSGRFLYVIWGEDLDGHNLLCLIQTRHTLYKTIHIFQEKTQSRLFMQFLLATLLSHWWPSKSSYNDYNCLQLMLFQKFLLYNEVKKGEQNSEINECRSQESLLWNLLLSLYYVHLKRKRESLV